MTEFSDMQFHGATIFASERDFKIVGFLNFIKNIYISDFFEGIAIGNGYLNAILNVNSLVSFSYNHGIVSEKDVFSNNQSIFM